MLKLATDSVISVRKLALDLAVKTLEGRFNGASDAEARAKETVEVATKFEQFILKGVL